MKELKKSNEVAISLAKLYRIVCDFNFWAEVEEVCCLLTMSDEIRQIPALFEDVSSHLYHTPTPKFADIVSRMSFTESVSVLLNTPSNVAEKERDILVRFIKELEGLKFFLYQHKVLKDGNLYVLPERLRCEDALPLLQRVIDAGFLDNQYKLMPGVTKSQAYIIAYAIIQHLKLERGCWNMFAFMWYGRDNRFSSTYIPKHRVVYIEKIMALYPEVSFTLK